MEQQPLAPVEALMLLPCVSAVARGVQQTLTQRHEADIKSVLGPQLSAAAAQSLGMNSAAMNKLRISKPSAPLTRAAAAAVPSVTLAAEPTPAAPSPAAPSPAAPSPAAPSPAAPAPAAELWPSSPALRVHKVEAEPPAPASVVNAATIGAAAAVVRNTALLWVPPGLITTPKPEVAPASLSTVTSTIPLVGPRGGFAESPSRTRSSPANDIAPSTTSSPLSEAEPHAATALASSPEASIIPEANSHETPAPSSAPDYLADQPIDAPATNETAPASATNIPARPWAAPSATLLGSAPRPASACGGADSLAGGGMSRPISRGYSRSGSWYPSPSATPPRMVSPTPQADADAPSATARPADVIAGSTYTWPASAATRVVGGVGGGGVGGAVGGGRKTAAAVVRAATEQKRAATGVDPARPNAVTPPHTSADRSPGSDLPSSVSWQRVTYGAHADTVLPVPSQPIARIPSPSYLPLSHVPSRPDSAASDPPMQASTGGTDALAAPAAEDDDVDHKPAPLGAPIPAPPPEPWVHSAYVLRPKPRTLVLSASRAVGAVTVGGQPRRGVHPCGARKQQPTSYHSLARQNYVEGVYLDGQERYLPPDRPTLLSHHRERFKKSETPSAKPFVGRCAKASFSHADAWLD